MHKLIEYVCDELKEIEKKAEKGDLSMSEVEYADKLAHLKKNLLKSEEMMEEFDEDYSSDVRPMYDASMRGRSYARGRGSNARRDSMGRYSRNDGYSRAAGDMAERLRDLMHDAPDESTKHEIRKLVEKMERM